MSYSETMTLEFTLIVNKCLGCKICPQEKLGGAYKSETLRMSGADFDTIIRKVPTDVRIDFSGFNEPFLHPLFDRFMTQSVISGYKVHVYSTLVGMREDQIWQLKTTPVEYFRVHVPDRTNLILRDEVWIRLHELFLKTGIKASYMAMDVPTERVSEHLLSHGIVVELPSMISRAGLIEHMRPQKKTGPIRCAADRFHCNVVLPNGDVVVCCMDWTLTMPVGNLLRQSYQEIFDKASEYEANIDPPDDSICRTCEWSEKI